MTSLETTFASLKLKSPIILSASSITNNVKNIVEAEKKGAGAAILRSLFEEEITDHSYSDEPIHPEAKEYLENSATMEYLNLIKEAKNATNIPIIASINCVGDEKWPQFTAEIEKAGADAIELNIMILPHKTEEDKSLWSINKYLPGRPRGERCRFTSSEQIEEQLYAIVKKVKESTKLPVIVKLPPYLTSIFDVADRLDDLNVDGITLFNRFMTLDYNIEEKKWVSKMTHSTPNEKAHALRWTALLKDEVKAQLSASTGAHDHEDAIKYLIAGANCVQLCSVIYEHGMESVGKVVDGLKKWMEEKGYSSLTDMREKEDTTTPPAILTRGQFLKILREKTN